MNSAVSEEKVAASLLSEALHPGGLRLTSRAARLAGISPGMKLLDVGCGTGSTLEFLSQEFSIVPYGVDISAEMIAVAVSRVNTAEFFVGDASALPFASGLFDAVICECTLSLLESTEGVYREIYRVLRPGGVFISSDVCDACCAESIRGTLDASGFDLICYEDHRPALTTYIAEMNSRLLSRERMSSRPPDRTLTVQGKPPTQAPDRPLTVQDKAGQTLEHAIDLPQAQIKKATYYLAVCRRR